MVSVLSNITDEHYRTDPFPHAHTTQAIEPSYFQELASNFPDASLFGAELWEKNNVALLLSSLWLLHEGLLAPIWREFVEYHHSAEFFREMVVFFGSQMREVHPDLEARLGKPLESLTVAPRRTGIEADIYLDCQFGVNTPVRSPCRVRGVHVDQPNKIANAILYMRLEEDDSEGGNFEIYRFRGQPKFQQVAVSDDEVETVKQVEYKANTLIFMINSPFALHGVSPRMPTPHPRRYINFLAEFREPIFDLVPYQDPPLTF